MISFTGAMTNVSEYKGFADTFSGATPLAIIKTVVLPAP
jgi:hypothetical protein